MEKFKHCFLILLLISTISIYGGIGVGESQEGPTPVELVAFSITLNNNIVVLNWKTATEINNYGFEVERKILSQVQSDESNWVKIGFVEGHGYSNSPNEYYYADNEKLFELSVSYRLKQIDTDGTFKYSRAIELKSSVMQKYSLAQNYPNPFNPTTNITYTIPQSSYVTLKIYYVLGNEICSLVNGYQDLGSYHVRFDASKLSDGIYFYRLNAGNFSQIKKMILIK